MNRVAGYRKMLGLTQKEVAKSLDITEATYRNKEKGRTSFKDYEMNLFVRLIKSKDPNIKIEDIFFND